MSESNKTICRRWVEEAINQRGLDRINEFISRDYQYHGPGLEIRGVEGEKKCVEMWLNGFSDIQFSIDDMLAEGDKVATRWTARGTHDGEFAGIPPTGKKVSLSGIIVSRIAGGKINEEWESYDELSLMKQIGAVAQ